MRENVVEQALKIIRNRIDQFGVAEPTIQAQGADEIVVQLPGIQDPQRAKDLIGRTALLEFKLVAQGPQAGTLEKPGPGVQVLSGKGERGRRARSYLVEKRTLMTGDVSPTRACARAAPRRAWRSTSCSTRAARKLFGDVTTQQRRAATSPSCSTASSSRRRSSASRSPAVAGRSRAASTSPRRRTWPTCCATARCRRRSSCIEERTVGPSLGQDSIRQGMLSFVVGGVARRRSSCCVYYRGGGADRRRGAARERALPPGGCSPRSASRSRCPGIAGIVLTIGMAVDANVLILERIREELRLGQERARGHRGRLRARLGRDPRLEHHDVPARASSSSSSARARCAASP